MAVCKKCEYGHQVIEGNCYPCNQALFNVIFSFYFSSILVKNIAQAIMPCIKINIGQ